MSEHDALLAKTLADHFPGARRDEISPSGRTTVALDVGDIRIACEVVAIREWGKLQSADLYFRIQGAALAEGGVFASVSGYAGTPEAAVVEGACAWSRSFGPVLRAGLGGEAGGAGHVFEAEVHGQSFRVHVDELDRWMSFGDADPFNRAEPARARFGGPRWILSRLIASGALPLLPARRPTIVSVFVSDFPTMRLHEVKVNGYDWPGFDNLFAEAAPEPQGGVVLLRELAVLVPAGEARPLERRALEATFAGLRLPMEHGRRATDWHGWRAHGGRLAPALEPGAVARVEGALGALPADYRAFLLEVAEHGAGPGYGLLSPRLPAQTALARGALTWSDGGEPTAPPAGVLALAEAGCGNMWLLVLSGPRRGEVWIDARASSGGAKRVAPSFDAWYRGWLDDAVANTGPWVPWDSERCASPHAFAQMLEHLNRGAAEPKTGKGSLEGNVPRGGLKIMSSGGEYFPPNAIVDPCHGCVALADHLGVPQDAFAPGSRPFEGASPPPPKSASPGGLGRWLRRVTGG